MDTKSIIPLTHVCRYWRKSIASVPANWTLISNFNKNLMALSLERAKATSLIVHLDMDKGEAGFFDVLAPYVQNIDTLHAEGYTTIEKFRQALPKFPQSTPNLRSLSLSSDTYWDRSIDPFESLTTNLRYLKLGNIPLYPSLLRLRSLKRFAYANHKFDLHLDTLLDFLEGNRMLEHVILGVSFREASLRSSRRQTAMGNRIQCLSIYCHYPMDGQAIISSIPLRRGAHLNITLTSMDGRLNDILSGVSTTHLLNLPSPTFIKYRSHPRSIQLFGPNGRLALNTISILGASDVFTEFPLLPLAHVREFHLIHRMSGWGMTQRAHEPLFFSQPSFPALETLAINCEISVSSLLSVLFSNPSSSPSLKTLAFMDCDITKDFMKELTQYASRRKATAAAWLYKVVIVNSNGVFPSIASIRKLKEHVSVVDVKVGTELPRDLA